MKLENWETPFFEVKWLVCDSLASDCEFGLELQLVELHEVPGKQKQEPVSDPVQNLINESTPIVETSESRRWRVTFDRAIAYKSESESYSFKDHWPDLPEKGRTFILESSPWIKEFGALLEDIEVGCKHYVLLTDHVIIEVISPNEPRFS